MNNSAALGPVPTPEPSATPGPAQRTLATLGQSGPAASVADLSTTTGAHPNTVRRALSDLHTAGLVQRSRVPTGGRGRPRFAYTLTTAGRHAQPSGRAFREYRSLTEAFATHLATRSDDAGADARAIGRTWGAALSTEQTSGAAPGAEVRVIDLLAELGFGPTPQEGGIALRTCPLLELAKEMPEVICQVHQGLVEGALEHYGAPADDVRLIPFAEVGACRLHLHAEQTEHPDTPPDEPGHGQ